MRDILTETASYASGIAMFKTIFPPGTVAALLLLAVGLPCQATADAYSDFVTGLSPEIYYRMDEDPILSPTPPGLGTRTENFGMGGAATTGCYISHGGHSVESTGASGGAIPGNAGVEITGGSILLPQFILSSGTAPFSLSIWVRPTPPASGTIFGYGGESVIENSMVLRMDAGGHVILDCLGKNVLRSHESLPDGEWSCVGVTYDGEESLRLYINGRLDSSIIGDVAGFGNRFALLGDLFVMPGKSPFHGALDDFAYWNGRVLTDEEMLRLADPSAAKP